MKISHIEFPEYSGLQCLMMPYIQGDPGSVPEEFEAYYNVIESLYFNNGDTGYLTIDESAASKGKPHRGYRAKYGRALHTEAGRHPDKVYAWGGGGWGFAHRVTLEKETQVLLANNLDDTCALWDATHENTSIDGDIGDLGYLYPLEDSTMMKAGDVHQIGILTPHESLPVHQDTHRQFIRIVSKGVHGRESYFTENPKYREGES